MDDIPEMISGIISITFLAVAAVTVPLWWHAMKPAHAEDVHRLVARYYGLSLLLQACWRAASWLDLAYADNRPRLFSQEINWGVTLMVWAFCFAFCFVAAVAYYRSREK